MKDQDEVTNDQVDVNDDPNDKGKSEGYSEFSSDSNEETGYPSGDKQVIRQHKLYIHSAWMALQSSYFRSLFFSGMKESSAKEVHVQILANEEQAHLMLVEAIYKIDTLDNADVDELLEVLRLAHKYDVKFVFKKCKYILQDMVDSLEICEQIMCFIKVENTITDVEDLVSILQSFLAKEFSPLDKTWQTTSFKDLCEPSLKYLLSSDELVTVSENTVFHALMYWIEERDIENVIEGREMPSLLSVVRFELIPVDYLYNIVQHHSVAKKLPDFNDHYLRGISYHALSAIMKQRLPHQSVKRKDETQPFVAYTWVIPTQKLSQSEETLKSEEFWYCGYKMILVISNIVKTGNLTKKHSVFTATLSLEICKLNEQSEVSIEWQPTSECFMFKTLEKTHVFEKEASSSSVDIGYKIEVADMSLASNVFSGVSASTTLPSNRFGSAPSSMPSTRVLASATLPSNSFGSAPLLMASPVFVGVSASTTQASNRFGSASPLTPSTRVLASATLPSNRFGSASPLTPSTRVLASATLPSNRFGSASPLTPSTRVLASATLPSNRFGSASPLTPSTRVLASATLPSIRFGSAPSSMPSTRVLASATLPSNSFGSAPLLMASPVFVGVSASTTQASNRFGSASPSTPSTGFGGVSAYTTQPSNPFGTAVSMSSTGFGGVSASKSESSVVHIDVKMKLL